jgi:hypothetical protein
MKYHTQFVLSIAACLVATLPAQVAEGQDSQKSSTDDAYVYVSSSPSTGVFQINGFSAASNGKLAAITGSPFSDNVTSMAVNGKYLFGIDGNSIDTFSIGPDGSLQEVSSIVAVSNGCGSISSLFLDHTGSSLYDYDYDGDGICSNPTYQGFSVNNTNGALTFLGTYGASEEFNGPMTFTGSDLYAYGSECYHFDPQIYGFKRNSDGSLTVLNQNVPMPTLPAGAFYCPYLAAADPTNNVAVPVTPLNASTWQPVGPTQLAVYTADSSGNLTTNSTYQNMPSTGVQSVTNLSPSPAGTLLAVAGTGGLQIFHFNGGNQITKYTKLLTTIEVDQMFWDNDNHLYGIAKAANKLFVLTVTPTNVSKAPGSPYTIGSPQNIIVQPK